MDHSQLLFKGPFLVHHSTKPQSSLLPEKITLFDQATFSLLISRDCLYIVRYHCGGWSEELNSPILLLAYMVYLSPKHSLGYQLHSYLSNYYTHTYKLATFRQLQAIIIYMHIDWQSNYGTIPLLAAFPFLIPFGFPSISFYLLGNLPCCDRIPSTLVPGCS